MASSIILGLMITPITQAIRSKSELVTEPKKCKLYEQERGRLASEVKAGNPASPPAGGGQWDLSRPKPKQGLESDTDQAGLKRVHTGRLLPEAPHGDLPSLSFEEKGNEGTR